MHNFALRLIDFHQSLVNFLKIIQDIWSINKILASNDQMVHMLSGKTK